MKEQVDVVSRSSYTTQMLSEKRTYAKFPWIILFLEDIKRKWLTQHLPLTHQFKLDSLSPPATLLFSLSFLFLQHLPQLIVCNLFVFTLRSES